MPVVCSFLGVNRRAFLERTAVVGTAVLAGCTGQPPGSGTEPLEPADPTPTRPPATTATPSPSPTPAATDTPTDVAPTATPGGTATASSPPDQLVIVAPYGELRFDPTTFGIAPGDSVRWIWEAGGHNVKPTAMPADSDWSGTPGSQSRTYSAGYAYSQSFDAVGTYEYECVPHAPAGMTGSFTVG